VGDFFFFFGVGGGVEVRGGVRGVWGLASCRYAVCGLRGVGGGGGGVLEFVVFSNKSAG